MAKDKIKINLITLNDKENFNLNVFLNSLKTFNFIHSNKFNSQVLYENLLIIIPQNFSSNLISSSVNKISKSKLSKIAFLIHSSQINYFKKFNFKCFHYPIKIEQFEKEASSFYSITNFSYKGFKILNNDILISNKSNEKVFLTEIESNLLKFLFINIKINKNILNTDVLSQNIKVESKSLETHLSRLRKKINQLDNSIKIVSNDNEVKIV